MSFFYKNPHKKVSKARHLEAIAQQERDRNGERFNEDWRAAIALPDWKPVFFCERGQIYPEEQLS